MRKSWNSRGYGSGGQEPPKFEHHTPYLNWGMTDLLELNELVSATKSEIIPPQLNKTIKACTPLVLMDLKPFRERPRNIPSGLVEEVKDHLDHMLGVGAIKPRKSAWSNAVVLVQKKDGGSRFCINF